jgi:hypothetical protein
MITSNTVVLLGVVSIFVGLSLGLLVGFVMGIESERKRVREIGR